MACHIAGIYDVNRNETLAEDNIGSVIKWIASIEKLKMHGILFHNHYSEDTCSKYESENLKFIKVAFDSAFKPNVYRYFVYQAFLQKFHKEISALFLTDVSDVEVIKNPFSDLFFIENEKSLFCGDEPSKLENEWMKAHSALLRSRIADYSNYEERFAEETLLNCGIIGGHINIMTSFIEKLSTIHQDYNFENHTLYTGDMGAFNYLTRTQFNEKLMHGSPINTVFKGYEESRNDCWFRHK